jgi:hypothetical protein
MYVYLVIHDGLGNQLFQIATAYAYAKDTGRTLKIVKKKQSDDIRTTYWNTALKRCICFLIDTLPVVNVIYNEEILAKYNQVPKYSDVHVVIHGYFVSPKYFNSYKDDIRRLFYPQPESIEKIHSLYGQYLGENTVTVHARRGDFIRYASQCGPLTGKYYKAATDIILEKILNPVFLLISDDDSYWSTILEDVPAFQDYPYIIVSHNSLTDYETLALFSQSQHLIIANSTFSWWGAYLANAETVISPKQWCGPAGPKDWEDIYCDDWIRV